MRACLGPSPGTPCPYGALTAKTRCASCARQRDRERRPHSYYRGYDREYAKAREQVIGGPCALALEGCTGVADTAHHLVPTSHGGTLADGIVGACGHCNYALGSRPMPTSR